MEKLEEKVLDQNRADYDLVIIENWYMFLLDK